MACSKSTSFGGGGTDAVAPRAAQAIAAEDSFPSSQGPIVIHPIHHASFLIQFAGKAIFVDPTKLGSIDGLPRATHIVLTHAHFDHFDPEGIGRIKTQSTVFIAPPILADKLPKPVVMQNGDSRTVDGIRFDALPMYNLQRGPSPGKLYHEKGIGNGYVVTLADKRLYISGDTECIPEMGALQKIDIAFLCMNLPYTMTLQEAAQCAQSFRPAVVYPYHSRGTDLDLFVKALASDSSIDVRIRAWY